MLEITLNMDWKKSQTKKIEYLEELGEAHEAYVLRAKELVAQYLRKKQLLGIIVDFYSQPKEFTKMTLPKLTENFLEHIYIIKDLLNCSNEDIQECIYQSNYGICDSNITVLVLFKIVNPDNNRVLDQKVYVYLP